MKKKKNIFFMVMMFLSYSLTNPLKAYADSGFDAKYDSATSSDLISSLLSLISPILELLAVQPNEEDYDTSHFIICSMCILLFYIFTDIYLFKLNNKNKKTIFILGISLIPTILFTLLCIFTKLQLILYIIISIIYIVIISVVVNTIIKKKLQEKINQVKEIDKNFNIDELNEKTFELYKKVQLAWMDYKLYKIKDLISDEILKKYEEQIDTLKRNNEKNIMDKIEFKSNKIIDIKVENNIEVIECKMKVSCYDYVINNDGKVIKGKKDKKNVYSYKLLFHKNLDTNKYLLVDKKYLKI